MRELEERIIKDGRILKDGILKVDSFINHQIDVELLNHIGAFLAEPFKGVNKILTVETSGIAFAIAVSQHLGNVPVVFAKKSKSKIVESNFLYIANVHSFTRGIVSPVMVDKRYLTSADHVLIVDDFLAEGSASLGLIDIAHQAGAEVLGVAVAIEKSFQGGRKKLEKEGYKVLSAAKIDKIEGNEVFFGTQDK